MGLMDALQDPLFWRDVRRNAKDLGQSASNAALSNVTGPVDMANSLLGLLGMKSAEPVGGSKWAERVGLSRQVNQGLPQVVGETLGLVAPFAGARAPQVANKLLEYTDNAMAPSAANQAARNQLGAIVYHGSPHKFDRFDASKIGTGEGAQAYGHGLYFAESPDVAKGYAKKLTDAQKLTGDSGKTYVPFHVGNTQSMNDAISLINSGLYKSVDDAINRTSEIISSYKHGDPRIAILRERLEAYKAMADDAVKLPEQQFYKVDLPDNAIARMLDWDKPLSQQAPEVRVALTNIAKQDPVVMDAFRKLGPNAPANQAYAALTQHAVRMKKYEGMRAGMDEAAAIPSLAYGQDAASSLMKKQGIPGIRYLDAGSRGAGAGTSNYVVFPGEESLLKILERNGVAP